MRTTTIAAAITGFLLLTGCSDGDEDPQVGSSATPTTSATAEPTETAPPEPVVEPATGFDFDRERITMRAPNGWKRKEAPADFLLQAADPKSNSTIILSDLEAFFEQPLAGQVRIALKSTPQLEELDPVEIAGVRWYHLSGPAGQFQTLDSFGTIHNGSEAVIDFSLDNDIPEDEQQQIIDSVLATVEWK